MPAHIYMYIYIYTLEIQYLVRKATCAGTVSVVKRHVLMIQQLKYY
jgi:hypothetical protein